MVQGFSPKTLQTKFDYPRVLDYKEVYSGGIYAGLRQETRN